MTTSWFGYRVDSPAGRVRTVEGIVPGSADSSCDLLLAVRLGRGGRRVAHVPLNDVAHVDTARQVVVLNRLDLHGQSAQQAPLAKSA